MWEVQGSVLDESKTFLNIRFSLSARVHALRGGGSPLSDARGKARKAEGGLQDANVVLYVVESRFVARLVEASAVQP